jgi:hypothetical protein
VHRARSQRGHHTRCAHGGALAGSARPATRSSRRASGEIRGGAGHGGATGAHPFGDAIVRVEATVYGGVCRRRVGSGGRQRPRGAPAARDRRGGEARRTDSGRKMAGAVLTGKVATTATMAWIPARSIALRRRHWTRGERGKWGGGGHAGSGQSRKRGEGGFSTGRVPVAF